MTVKVGSKELTLDDFYSIIYEGESISLEASALDEVKKSFNFLKEFSKDKILYGVNTGFGPMAPYMIEEKEQVQLQYNLIRSHASGSGGWLHHDAVKAIMLVRLKSMLTGYSGVNESVPILLKELINRNIAPLIPVHGSVGASGDLVQLAHLALVLIGEGEVSYKGKTISTKKVFELEGLKPIRVEKREGLAIINGTAAMSGIAAINLLLAYNLMNWAILSSSFLQEIFQVYDDSFSKELNNVKLHHGQRAVAEDMRKVLSKSNRIRKRHEYLYNKKLHEKVLDDKVQEYYSIRCVPQVIGPIYDTLKQCKQVVLEEVNSSSDNPVVDRKNKNVFHGGNFHGDYVSFEMDKLKIAITKLSMLCERQLAFMMNDNLTKILPPFVNLGTLGLNLGMQGVQFTATSTVAENQTLSFPMYVHSIPTNKDNQDIVSMGTNSAEMAQRVIENSFEVIAIQFMAILQAVDYLKAGDKLAPTLRKYYEEMRRIIPVFKQDAVRYEQERNLKLYLLKTQVAFN